jgi:serine/threonine protein phosphatase PrpC
MVGSLMSSEAMKWRTAYASVVGQAHLNQKTECQDRFVCRMIETKAGEILIAVVADGAGSAAKGHVGAQAACDLFAGEAAAFLQNESASVKSLNLDFGRRWISYFRRQIEEIAGRGGAEIRAYASTLVAAVVGESEAAFYQIGDGAIVFSAFDETETYRFGIEPTETLYVNETDFLTDDDAAAKIRFEAVEETVEDLILFSDGIFPVAVNYQTNRPHAPFLKPMLAPLRNGNPPDGLNAKLESFLASPKINEKTDDDKTIILASRHQALGAANGVKVERRL